MHNAIPSSRSTYSDMHVQPCLRARAELGVAALGEIRVEISRELATRFEEQTCQIRHRTKDGRACA